MGNLDSDVKRDSNKRWTVVENQVQIPYIVTGPSASAFAWNLDLEATGPEMEQDFKNAEAIFAAIDKWNATGIVLLTNLSSKDLPSPPLPPDYAQFSTTSENSFCRTKCIGKCGVQTVDCDLSGVFKNQKEQSIMHEIGHVLGLRHEHARPDRKDYILTNFLEEKKPCIKFGPYDFASIMHYPIGYFDGGKYILRKHGLNIPDQILNDGQVEKMISDGDYNSVTKLYNLKHNQSFYN